MANGKPGDHPFSDMLLHGRHPFPRDMEAMLRALYAKDPRITGEIEDGDFLVWEKRQGLAAGRALLQGLCDREGIDHWSLTRGRHAADLDRSGSRCSPPRGRAADGPAGDREPAKDARA